MQIVLPEGRYVVAVSGGVDSVALLHNIVVNNPELVDSGKLVVAHFDHGIRKNSARDAIFVEELSQKYGLQYVVGHGGLGPDASEDDARKARYGFLQLVKRQNHSDAIVTAHHKDDITETAIINILRGTGRRGLSSLKERKGLLRPLLNFTKDEIIKYAEEQDLEWNEDETNASHKYLRNRIRSAISAKKDSEDIKQLEKRLENIHVLNQSIDKEIENLMRSSQRRYKNIIARKWFVKLSYDLSCEVVLAQLKNIGANEIDSKLIESLVVFMKTGKIGKKKDIDKNHYALVTKRSIRFENR